MRQVSNERARDSGSRERKGMMELVFEGEGLRMRSEMRERKWKKKGRRKGGK